MTRLRTHNRRRRRALARSAAVRADRARARMIVRDPIALARALAAFGQACRRAADRFADTHALQREVAARIASRRPLPPIALPSLPTPERNEP